MPSIHPTYWAYKIAFETPLETVLPKRLKNVIYRQFITSLTRHNIDLTEPGAILTTEPIQCDRTSDARVWIVSSGADLLMAVWCLKTLLHFSKCSWDVWFADAGGISHAQRRLLQQHFPNIRFRTRSDLDHQAREALTGYPLSAWLRHTRKHPLALKLFDPMVNLQYGKFLLVDSDVLFFRNPCLLVDLVTDNNAPPGVFHFNMEPRGTINSGLAVIDLSLFSLSDIEGCLARMQPQRLRGLRGWTIEQDVYTDLASARFQPLPASYGVQPIDDAVHSNLTSCHYISVCRHQFYRQGISRLRAEGFLGLSSLHK
jgi:hypothetical protein